MPTHPKVLSHTQLMELRSRARLAGQTVVHCHGCFDIVHPGHVHHLQYARSLGDVLIVSLSSDSHVNKGAARPLIPHDLRALNLAALECVDAVYVNPHPTARELLESLRPDLYVKGKEYELSVDPRFQLERETVIRNGGRVVYSSGDIVFSSSAIISEMTRTDPFEYEKLQRLFDRYGLSADSLAASVDSFAGLRAVVIGDYIQDRYHFCDATGIAGEAPMMALRSLESRSYDGGAAIVAQHLSALGAKATLVTSLADDDPSAQVAMRLRSSGIDVESICQRRSLVAKNRYLVDDAKLFKVDEGSAAPLDSSDETHLAARILEKAQGADLVIFADFGYGVLTAGLLARVLRPLRQGVRVLTADVSGRQSNLLRFLGVDLLCPTERETRETMQNFSGGLGAVVANLLQLTRAKQAIITLGKQGLVTFDNPEGEIDAPDMRLRSEYIPALSGRSVDPLGCGDALLATASLALAAGVGLQGAAFLGALAAAAEVRCLGNVPVGRGELLQLLSEQFGHRSQRRLAG